MSLDLWWARPSDAKDDHLSWFTDAERTRAAAYRHDVDRGRFIVGCALSRLVVADVLGCTPAEVPLTRKCGTCERPHGKPRVVGDPVHLSVSHSGDHVVVAVTRSGPVGVDVEEVSERAKLPVSIVLAASERALLERLYGAERTAAFYRYWVRKESVVKATGDGLRAPLSAVIVSGSDDPARLVSMPNHDASIFAMADVDIDVEHAAAVTVIGPETISPRTWDASTSLRDGNMGTAPTSLDNRFTHGQS
ncbi:4'-phosphopantetheinyl transferase family protein [Stackebrandtia soli]|uniref:4'-phosphopantetheinyl transferase family protein n=1 Tax=Stackebrandtia soli TaxID=1892856 RepID=UPI0039E78B15